MPPDAARIIDAETPELVALAKAAGQTPKSISCPDDLDAKAGAQETCILTADDGTTFNMTATVKSVDGDNTELTFQVADHASN